MSANAEIEQKVQELQVFEHNLQNFSIQKQSSQIELNEVINASDEVAKSSGEVYKVVGGVMLKSTKEILSKELAEKKKILELRISSVEKQEKLISGKAESLRKELTDIMSKKKQ